MKKSIFWITVLTVGMLVVSIAGAQRAPRRGGNMEPGYLDLSSILKMSPDEFRDARRSGKTIAEIAKEKGLTEEQLKERVVAQRKLQVEQLLKDGKITQEQADYCFENMGKRMPGSGGQGQRGNKQGRGCRGGGQGRGRGFANN